MKKRILILISIILLLCGCSSNSQNDYISDEQLANQQSEIILQGIINKDAESIKELFCPYVKEVYPDLENQIKGMFDFIDGEIVSYDEPDGERWSSSMTELEGTVEEAISGKIANIKTSTGKTYCIIHCAHSVDKQHPEYVGVTDVKVLYVDMYDSETGYPEGAKYEISCPEMWE